MGRIVRLKEESAGPKAPDGNNGFLNPFLTTSNVTMHGRKTRDCFLFGPLLLSYALQLSLSQEVFIE